MSNIQHSKSMESFLDSLALGYVDGIRFLQQYDSGQGDYTKERHQWLDPLTMNDFRAYIKLQRDREI